MLLGYFFGPRLSSADEADLVGLEPNRALLCLRFGDLGIIREEWLLLGRLSDWDRSAWRMPRFVRRDPLGKLKPRLVEYSDNDPNHVVGEWVVEDETDLPTNSLSGSQAVSIKLDNLLGHDADK